MPDKAGGENFRQYSIVAAVDDEAITRAIDSLRPKQGYKDWQWQRDLHITLATPGPVPGKRLGQLKSRLKESASRLKPWDARFDSLRSFFNVAAMNRDKYPIILWAAPDPQSWLRFQFVHADLVKSLQPEFRVGRLERLAHITIGRGPQAARQEALDLISRPVDFVYPFREFLLTEEIPDAGIPVLGKQGKPMTAHRTVEAFKLSG